MYKLKEKYKAIVGLNAWTSLDIECIYSLDEWVRAGFSLYILEEVK